MPTIPEQLAEIIALHKSMFGGFEMNASTAGGDGAAQPTDPPADGANPPAEPPAQDSTDWKAEARKWEQRAKDNKSAADRLAQVEDANKTDLQKAQDAAAKAVADAQAAQLELSRERIARRHKLADEDAELLSGDEEQMERLAARLAQAATPPATPPAGGAPKAPPVPGIGKVPETRNIPLSDQITAAEKAGDKALVATLKAMMLTSPGQ